MSSFTDIALWQFNMEFYPEEAIELTNENLLLDTEFGSRVKKMTNVRNRSDCLK